MTKQKIIIEGIGGIGGVLAGHMIREGLDPILMTGNKKIADAINENGLKITTPEDEFTIEAKAYASLDVVPVPDNGFDVAYLIMKATRVVGAVKTTLPLIKPNSGHVVTFQNGIVEDAVSHVAGSDKVISCIVGWGGTMHAPGVYERTGPGNFYIGELNGENGKRVKELAKVLETATPCVLTNNIRGTLWSKLAINCMITTVGALTGQTLGEMLKARQVRRVFNRIYSEVVDTAEALGVQLERVVVNPRFFYMSKDANFLTVIIKDFFMRQVAKKHGKLKSSSLQSLERGRGTEIDFLNGYVVDRAKEVGVETPINAALVRMIKEIEDGQRSIALDNMNELLTYLK
jgi:2-dehydropantoate 2-reductase